MFVKMMIPNLVYATFRDAGEVVEVHDERAREMISAGAAEPCDPPGPIEVRVASIEPAMQTADIKPRRRKAKGAD